MPAPIAIAPSERVFLTGRTGSGKSTMARRLLRATDRWVVLDPKMTFRVGATPIRERFDPSLPRQIIRLPYETEDEIAGWGEVVRAVYEDGDRVLYADEVLALTRPARLPRDLGWAIRTGRERNIGVWSATQRPKDIPSALFTETEHFFVYQLSFAADREKVLSFTDERLEPYIARLTGHDCLYWRVGMDDPILIH